MVTYLLFTDFLIYEEKKRKRKPIMWTYVLAVTSTYCPGRK